MQIGLKDFSVNRAFQSDEALQVLKDFGACVYPGWVKEPDLKALRDEFYKLLKDKNEAHAFQISYPPGSAASLDRNKAPEGLYPNINKVFTNAEMADLCDKYVGYNCAVNYEIYATHEIKEDVDIAPTHFDKLFTLKFMIYLNDVGPQNGPFGVIPKSASVARDRFRGIFKKERISELQLSSAEYSAMDNLTLGSDDWEVVDIIGKAGTLVIFDSDTFHHAGCVSNGFERMILRGHSGIGVPGITYKSVKKGTHQYIRGEQPNVKRRGLFSTLFN